MIYFVLFVSNIIVLFSNVLKEILCIILAQSAGVVEYTDCISSEGYPPTSVLDVKLNNLMVRLH